MNRLLTAAVAAAGLWATACSGGHPIITPPPPSGNYTLASLSGTYAFTTSGEVFDGASFHSLSRVGSFVADGQGHITGGIEDVNSSGTPSGAIGITGGNYTVKGDGRGTLTLDFGGTSVDFGITLTSTSDGLMIDETSTSSQASTGSGNFVKQDATVCSSPVQSVSGTYILDFAGLDSSGSPESFVGEFTANGSGATFANLGDLNDSGALSNGTFTASFATDGLNPAGPTACGRGKAQFTTGSVTETYAYYVVDATRIRFINAAGGEMLSGDAVLQPSVPAAPSGGFAFLVAGASANAGLIRVGRFTVSNSTVSKILMDVNDAGTQTPLNNLSNPAIDYDPTTGRGQLSFQSSAVNVFSFVFYLSSPSSGVIQEVSGPNANTAVVVADGSVLAQSGSPFTSSNITGPYALNWSGLVTSNNVQDEEDLLAQVTVTNLSLSGTSDLFQFTSSTLTPLFDVGTGGQMTFLNSGNGTGDDGNRVNMDVNLSNTSSIHMVVYIVSPQLAFFTNRDNNGAQRIVAGVLQAQQ
jgi:hypothetical protein